MRASPTAPVLRRASPKSMRTAPALDHLAATPRPAFGYALLINPFYPKDPLGSFGKHVLTPSQALTSIAAVTPKNWEVRYWDENLLQGPPPGNPFPSVVGITVHLTFARRAYELAYWYRSRGAFVVLGGPHVTACPEEASPYCDAVAIGEGVQLWPRILRDAERGWLEKKYIGSYKRSYAGDPVVQREVLDHRHFLTTASLIATRGCRNRCDFCYLSTEGLRMPRQVRDPDEVAKEFEATGEPYGVFIDNNLGVDKAYLGSLCRVLASKEKIWSAAVSLDVTDDPDLIQEMAISGCVGVFVGFESLNGENLSEAGKNGPSPDDYSRRVAIFHRHGIQVNGSFVFGFDHDRLDVFEKTVKWIEANRLECATFHILTPYPGTPLFRRMAAQGRLLHQDWSRYDTAHCVFEPKQMTPEELERGYVWCYKRIFSPSSIWNRRPRRILDVPGYLAMSFLYKKMNLLWPWIIRGGLTHRIWKPLVEQARRRHLRFRRRIMEREEHRRVRSPIVPGV